MRGVGNIANNKKCETDDNSSSRMLKIWLDSICFFYEMSIFMKKYRHHLLKFVWVYDSSLLNNSLLRKYNETSTLNMNYLKPNFSCSLLGIGQVIGCLRSGNIRSRFSVYKTGGGKSCWKCGKNLKDSLVFCDECSSLQRVSTSSNYFEIVGIDCAYDLNLSEVSKKYKNLQSQLHPDRFGNKTEVS